MMYMKIKQRPFATALGLLTAFLLWTAALRFVDVQPIGPQGSVVGFASVNRYVHTLTGVHMALYEITDRLSVIPLGVVLLFALLGLCQWIRRGSIRRVDSSILLLGAFYVLVLACYVFFEAVVINYRPVLIDGKLEASYPSSTTMLVLCVMPTAIMEVRRRMRPVPLKRILIWMMSLFTLLMVIGRMISGVHWFTDIIGGIFLGAGLTQLYKAAADLP
jgi:undecaprenyl-diphosphatase